MIRNKLYAIVKGEEDPEGQMIHVEPTEYLLSLEPREAVDELQANVELIAEQLEEYSEEDLEVPENVEKVRSLVLELEIAQRYLAEVFKSWGAKQPAQVEGPYQ